MTDSATNDFMRQHRGEHPDELIGDLVPGELFAAYYLGLNREGRQQAVTAQSISRSLGISPDELLEALALYGLAPEMVRTLDFDLVSAQMDVTLAPRGIDVRLFGRVHYQALLEAESIEEDDSAPTDHDEETIALDRALSPEKPDTRDGNNFWGTPAAEWDELKKSAANAQAALQSNSDSGGRGRRRRRGGGGGGGNSGGGGGNSGGGGGNSGGDGGGGSGRRRRRRRRS